MLHEEALRDLYRLRSVVRTVTCRKFQWTGHVARTGETRNSYRISVGNLLGNVHLEDRKGDGRRTLRWIFGWWVVRRGGGCNLLKIVSNDGHWYWRCCTLWFLYHNVGYLASYWLRQKWLFIDYFKIAAPYLFVSSFWTLAKFRSQQNNSLQYTTTVFCSKSGTAKFVQVAY